MNRFFLLMAIIALITGCDAPQRTRSPGTWINGNSLGDPYSGIGFTNTPTNGGVASGTSSGTTVTLTSGFEKCDLSDKYQTIDIGWFGICQSSKDETIFRFRTSLPSSLVRVCLIPTYKDGSGSSTYIGRPQCTLTSANQIVNGTLYKDRANFTTSPLNGVIVMKEPLIPEYMACMHGFANWPQNACPVGINSNLYCRDWIPRCPYGVNSSSLCHTEAKNYMGRICTSFKNKYSNSYIDITTK